MAITKAMKQLLRNNKNVVAERITARGSNALRLRLTNGKDVYLLNKDGKVTEYGRYWYDEVKNEATPRTQFDPNARLVKKIRTDYIRTMDGKEKAVRTWKPSVGHIHIHCTGTRVLLAEASTVHSKRPNARLLRRQ